MFYRDYLHHIWCLFYYDHVWTKRRRAIDWKSQQLDMENMDWITTNTCRIDIYQDKVGRCHFTKSKVLLQMSMQQVIYAIESNPFEVDNVSLSRTRLLQ